MSPNQNGWNRSWRRRKKLMAGRILPITQAVAERWGCLNAPDPLPVIDSFLAATALEYGLTFGESQ